MKAHTSLTAFSLCCLLLTGCKDKEEQVEKPPRPVEVINLSAGADNAEAQFTGVLQAAERANLAFRVPGNWKRFLSRKACL